MKLLNIGFGSMVAAGRVLSVLEPESAPIKRVVQEAKERGMLIDASYGRKTRSGPFDTPGVGWIAGGRKKWVKENCL